MCKVHILTLFTLFCLSGSFHALFLLIPFTDPDTSEDGRLHLVHSKRSVEMLLLRGKQ